MPLDKTMYKAAMTRVVAKEITLFFASPIAYLFLGTFAAVTLFVFFWGEAFFARNIADVRPMFEWMPVLLIFLSAALTMRLWSEERRSGTLEHIYTQAIPLWCFVLGKFLSCLFLLALALTVTLPLPVTVAIIGDLDWGPVWAGYLATLLLGATYLSIGLFVSARSDNQIVSLITASVLSGIFYLLGTTTITDLFGNQTAEWLRLLGTGSRFDSITRGVVDLRDLYYYVSLVLVFLALNTLMLEKGRWAGGQAASSHHQYWRLITALLIANALAANFWLGQLNSLRMDVTEGRQYSISDATENYLAQLQEPLLIRGYFSGKTHPLLAPLVPQMRDLIREYEIVGNGRVKVAFIDPLSDPQLEQEANQQYGIQPVPFQVADRYQSSIVSSYFNVLIQYGDEYEVLGFGDLIEIQARSEADINVQLRNPEYDLTQAIKKVLSSYQAGGNLFETVKSELAFNGYFSDAAALPEQLVNFKQAIGEILVTTQKQSQGRFTVNFIDPDADHGKIGQQIAEEYGFKPMATSLFSDQQFYFYMMLEKGEQRVQIPLDDLTADSFKRNLQSAIKRFASGFTKTVALVVPQSNQPAYGQDVAQFSQLESFLGAELNVVREDLSDGRVSGEADILILAAPKALDDRQLFAIDQFLMQGGTVIAATSPYSADLSNRSLNLQKYDSGLQSWLQHHGFVIEEKLVLDPQNAAFPVPINRNVGGFQLQEIRLLDYPYFIDIRGIGLNRKSLITAELPQATLAWASPIQVDTEKQAQRSIAELLASSDQSWLSTSLDIMPGITQQGLSMFSPEGDQERQLLGVMSQGQFNSYYSGKPSPLLAQHSAEPSNDAENQADETLRIGSVIEHSPESARIILIGSNDFLRDQVIALLGSAQHTDYLNTLQMIANAVDWSLADTGLLSIRSRGHFNRTLPPMTHTGQLFWEYLNYGLAILVLTVIALWERRQRHRKQCRYLEQLT